MFHTKTTTTKRSTNLTILFSFLHLYNIIVGCPNYLTILFDIRIDRYADFKSISVLHFSISLEILDGYQFHYYFQRITLIYTYESQATEVEILLLETIFD